MRLRNNFLQTSSIRHLFLNFQKVLKQMSDRTRTLLWRSANLLLHAKTAHAKIPISFLCKISLYLGFETRLSYSCFRCMFRSYKLFFSMNNSEIFNSRFTVRQSDDVEFILIFLKTITNSNITKKYSITENF